MTTIKTKPAIYVGTCEKYNNGSINGAWLKLEDYKNKEEFLEACRDLHSDEVDPELMFQDFTGFPREFYNESYINAKLWEYLALEPYEKTIVDAFSLAIGGDIEYCLENALDRFFGTAETEAEFAEMVATEYIGIREGLPSWLVIDWHSSWEYYLKYDYYTAKIDGVIYFFSNY